MLLGLQEKFAKYKNCKFENGDVLNNYQLKISDFGYCLGVLHHISDTKSGLKHVEKLKKGALFFYIFIIILIINRTGLNYYGRFQTF